MGTQDGVLKWGECTASQVRNVAERDGSVAVIPAGSVEQHGDHLPVGTDTILAEEVTHAAAERVSEDVPVLVAPSVSPGFSPHHQPFGGTLSIEHETLVGFFEDVATSALSEEFDVVLFVNGHRGNGSMIESAVSVVGAANPDSAVAGVTYFDLAAPYVDEIRQTDVGGMSHAGEFETSLMLHCRPALVDEDQFVSNSRDEPHEHGVHDMFDGGPLSRYRTFTEYTDSGVVGDPTAASAETGRAIFQHVVSELADIIRELHEFN
ncbi:creatininase family protein [Halopenitus sp. H-Gu1]|uniref:creatininase family protein n=1 Tax=Halopenitus sp. H-Gu1 TaxID=3242697 RepID=UPI00359EDC4A